MTAQAVTFSPWLQEPMEAGALSPRQAWVLEWEVTALQNEPWTPEAMEVNRLQSLYHWQPAVCH